MRVAIGVLILVCGLAVSALAQQSPPAGAVTVATVVAARKPIAKTADFVGRVDAVNRVEIRARITGYLDEVVFKEGDFVKVDQPLYRIEKGLFQAAVEQAEGALAADQAKKLLTAIQLRRAEELVKTNATTVVSRDQALTADRAADAAIMVDQANVDTAKINLGYTDILSPIVGKIGRTEVTKGNVVSPDRGVLTVIVSQDPMYILFPVSEREIMQARRESAGGGVESIKVRLSFADGSSYDQIGKIDFVDVTVDRTTDTVQVRAVFPNPAGILIDGQLVTVNLEAGKPQEQVVVPQAALISDQQGVYVFIVENGQAAIRRIKLGGNTRDGGAIVAEGLSGGEQIVVDGLQTLRAGAAVLAKPAPPGLSQG